MIRASLFEFDAQRVLFQARVVSPIVSGNQIFQAFDVSPDRTPILAVTIPEESRPRQIDLLLNWAGR